MASRDFGFSCFVKILSFVTVYSILLAGSALASLDLALEILTDSTVVTPLARNTLFFSSQSQFAGNFSFLNSASSSKNDFFQLVSGLCIPDESAVTEAVSEAVSPSGRSGLLSDNRAGRSDDRTARLASAKTSLEGALNPADESKPSPARDERVEELGRLGPDPGGKSCSPSSSVSAF